MFPYPVKTFFCRPYPKRVKKKMLEFDKTFYNNLCAYAGAVAGETGVPGLKLDFRAGLRLEVPEGAFHVRLSDGETGAVLFDENVSGKLLVSMEKYYQPWHIEVRKDGQMAFTHDFDVTGQEVYVAVLSRSLGDMLAFLPSIVEYAETSGAHVTLCVPDAYEELVRLLYPAFSLTQKMPEDAYAAFYIGNGNGEPHQSPVDGRIVPLQEIARIILGLEGKPPAPPASIRERLASEPRPIAEPYVCISVQASSTLKSWLWPGGWDEVVAALKEAGYRVLCIDKDREQKWHDITIRMPDGAEDFTGDRPLVERARLLAHAAFCVGLGSGLSWLAWSVGCPVVMIAGFSLPWYEFPEAERVWNPRVCHGCFNDTEKSFLHAACPRHGERSPQFMECQKQISPAMVLRAIRRLQDAQARTTGEASEEHQPLLTLSVPTYNRSRYLRKCLEALCTAAGDNPDVEIFISDNASTDDTPELIAAYKEKYPSIRQVRQEENVGAMRNMDYLRMHARGCFVVTVGDDDYLQADAIAQLLQLIRQQPDVAMITALASELPYRVIHGKGMNAYLQYVSFFTTYITGLVFRTEYVREMDLNPRWDGNRVQQVALQMEILRDHPDFAVLQGPLCLPTSGESVQLPADDYADWGRKAGFPDLGRVFIGEYLDILFSYRGAGLSDKTLEREKKHLLEGMILPWCNSIRGGRVRWQSGHVLEFYDRYYKDEPYYLEKRKELEGLVKEDDFAEELADQGH